MIKKIYKSLIVTIFVFQVLNGMQNPIDHAFQSGDVAQIKNLLNNNKETLDLSSYLQVALRGKKINEEQAIEVLRFLNEKNAINLDKFIYYFPCEHIATQYMKIIRIAHLLGGNVNYSKDKKTALTLAIYYRNTEFVNCLISLGADVNFKSYEGSLIHIAISRHSYQIVWLLLEAGADITVNSLINETLFNIIKKDPYSLEYIASFVSYIVELENIEETKGAENALLICAYFDFIWPLDALLQKGAWFKSEKYELYFNKLIANKPAMCSIVKKYKEDLTKRIDQDFDLIPNLAKIVAE